MKKKEKRNIPFSPPDITNLEKEKVIEVLESGWITTGPRTKEFERNISDYCGTEKSICLNSATASMEMCLRMLGIGPGDEVITSAYTYTASASVIDHVGAKIVLVDTDKDSYHLSYDALRNAITQKTKAIIAVDIAGVMCDYEKIFQIIEDKKNIFSANNEIQEYFGRIVILADAAHSFGARYKDKMSGNVADFTSFSFHAVKNITTAEGGALTWRTLDKKMNDEIYNTIHTLSLHGQTKDAFSKNKLGAWEYDIISTAYKCNMTDIQAAIGLAQLERYKVLLKRRADIVSLYEKLLGNNKNIELIRHKNSSRHLLLVRVKTFFSEEKRNLLIKELAEQGISTNVHYKPLPLLTAYRNKGFDIGAFPNAMNMYKNEITLPLHTKLTQEDVMYICTNLIGLIETI